MKKILLGLAALVFTNCADFNETYENIIPDKKVRPFAIITDKPEAMPGDTISLDLKMYDAGLNYEVEWELSLNTYYDNYEDEPYEKSVVDLDSMALEMSADGLKLKFVVPTGKDNPILLSEMLRETVLEKEELPESFDALASVIDLEDGVQKKEMVDFFESQTEIPNELSPEVDEFLGLIQVRAKIKAPNQDLDVTKQICIRYSSKLASGKMISNVNTKPELKRLALIDVHTADLEDYELIKNHQSDTTWLNTQSQVEDSQADTIKIQNGHSYFLYAQSNDIPDYRSPNGNVFPEGYFFSWQYSNLDKVADDWGDQLGLNFHVHDNDSVANISFPKNKNMKNARIYITLRDHRPEWMNRAPNGIDFMQSSLYFDYQ